MVSSLLAHKQDYSQNIIAGQSDLSRDKIYFDILVNTFQYEY